MRFNTERSVRSIFSEEDKDYLISRLQQEIDKIKAEIVEVEKAAETRIEYVNDCLQNKKFSIIGSTYKNGKNKEILLIIKLEDNTQFDERYSLKKIVDMREKLTEL